MIHSGEERTNGIRFRFNPSIGINFQRAKLSSDTGILLLREIDERFGITSALEGSLQDSRIVSHTQHSCTDLLRQRVYQIAAGYEDCNDANELRTGSLLKSGIEEKFIDLSYQAGSWEKPRRVVCRIAWHENELSPQIGFVVTNPRTLVEKVIKVYHRRAEIENRIKEGKNTLRWDRTSCHRFESSEARLKMGLLAYNLLHLLQKFYIRGEGVQRSVEWLIRRLIKVGAKFSYHARRWQVQVSSAFPLRHHYLAVIDSG